LFKQIKKVEEGIKTLFDHNETWLFLEEEFNSLKEIEGKNKNLLTKEEIECRLKRKSIWLSKGDRNTKFFHKYSSHRININTIWGNQ